ncbi:hypothetical protein OEZ85_001785 [Tetradesmus obliquus]|uniref:Uncharacterized protein n=1 Tax=Tetradesmus obliquus TaxID=3088 RepID=A0ABY8U525_TETOB|nr:hypothetical protein OEZ85_001785 [Tetradesmus obliquus]
MALLLTRNLPALGRSAACSTIRRHVFLTPVRAASGDAKPDKPETVGKAMLAKHLAEDQSLSVKKATEVIDALLDDIMLSVAEGKTVTIPGFGSWKKRTRAARKGRNPQTGEPLDIPEGVAPAFSAGNVFKGVVKKGSWDAYEQWAEEEKAAAAAKRAAKKNFSPRSSGAGAELAGVSAMQQELESIQAKLEHHEARLEQVRAGIHDAKASNNREEWQQLQQENVELLGVIRELQAEKNRLSSQSAAAAAAGAAAAAAPGALHGSHLVSSLVPTAAAGAAATAGLIDDIARLLRPIQQLVVAVYDNQHLPTQAGCPYVRAAHIMRRATPAIDWAAMDLGPSPGVLPNVVPMMAGVERAFDSYRMCAVPSRDALTEDVSFEIHILDPALMTQHVYQEFAGRFKQDHEQWTHPSSRKQQRLGLGDLQATELTFGQLHKQPLVFLGGQRPARRCFTYHAFWALRHAGIRGWDAGGLVIDENHLGWLSPAFESRLHATALWARMQSVQALGAGSDSQWAESRQWRTEGRAKLLHNHYKAGTPLPEWAKTLDDKDYPDYFELQTAVKKAVASGGASVVQTPSNPVVQETTERFDHQDTDCTLASDDTYEGAHEEPKQYRNRTDTSKGQARKASQAEDGLGRGMRSRQANV